MVPMAVHQERAKADLKPMQPQEWFFHCKTQILECRHSVQSVQGWRAHHQPEDYPGGKKVISKRKKPTENKIHFLEAECVQKGLILVHVNDL